MSRYSPQPEPVRSSYNSKPEPRLLSTREAAAYLGVSPNTIRKYRKQGLRFSKVGEKLVKYDPLDLDDFAQKSA
jgi:excisionase family DNA binding protein